jgi:hypothetical protein
LGDLSRQCGVVSIREIAIQRGVASQLQCAHSRANRSKPGAGDVDTVKHLVQQIRSLSRTRQIEGLFQTIGQEVGRVEIE